MRADQMAGGPAWMDTTVIRSFNVMLVAVYRSPSGAGRIPRP
jgi:hypothetical protein